MEVQNDEIVKGINKKKRMVFLFAFAMEGYSFGFIMALDWVLLIF
jgi:hypothetical protein